MRSIRDLHRLFASSLIVVLGFLIGPAAAEWTDITAQVTANRGGQYMDVRNWVIASNFSIANNAPESLTGPLRVVVTDTNVPVSSGYGAPDGTAESDGKPYWLLSAGDGDGLAPGATSIPERIHFAFQRARLSYSVRVEQDIEVAVEAKLTVTPSSLEFGDVLAGGSESLQFSVANTGDADLEVTGIALSGVGFELFPPLSFMLAPGASATAVSVGFSPDAETGFSGTVTVQSNAGTADVSLSGNGLAATGPGDIDAVNSIDFGSVEEGDTVQQELVVSNAGDGLLTLTDATTDNGGFTVMLSGADSLPMTLNPGDTRNLLVNVTPVGGSGGSAITATLRLLSDDPDESPLDIALSADAVSPTAAPANVPVSDARVQFNPFDLITADTCNAVGGLISLTDSVQTGDELYIALTDTGGASVSRGPFPAPGDGSDASFSGIDACGLGDGIISVNIDYYRSGALLGTFLGTPAVKHTTALSQPVLDPLPPVTSNGTVAVCGNASIGNLVRVEGGSSSVSVQLDPAVTDFCVDVPLRRNTQNTLIATAIDTASPEVPKPAASAQPVQIVHVDPSEVVVASASSRPLTTEEVETLVANGVIDLDSPENFHVSMFTIVLTIGATPGDPNPAPPITYSAPIAIPTGSGPSGGSNLSPGGIYYGPAPSSGCQVNCGQVVSIQTPDGRTIPGVIIIDGRIKTLKEFFQVTIAIDNTSEGFALTDVFARILVPAGLTVMSNAPGVDVADVPPGSQVADVEQVELGRIESLSGGIGQFIVRGDSAGDYNVAVEFDGFIAEGGIPTPLSFNGRASTSLRVYGPPELTVVVRHPRHDADPLDPSNPLGFDVQVNEIYDLIVEITNESPRPALYTSLDLFVGGDSRLVDASGNPIAGSHQDQPFGHIQPGQTVSAAFRVQSLVQGEILACQAVASENINLSIRTLDTDDPIDCAIANTYPASFVPLAADQPPVVIGINPLNGAPNVDISASPFVTLTPESACIVGDSFKNVVIETRTNGAGMTYNHVVSWQLDQPGTFYVEELDALGNPVRHIPTDLTVVTPPAGGTTIATLRLGLDSPWLNSQYFFKANTRYRATLVGGTGGVCSAASGAEMENNYSWTFSTAQNCSGVAAPIATLATPADGSIDRPLNQQIVVQFTNRMNPGSFAFVPGDLGASSFGVYQEPNIDNGVDGDSLIDEGIIIPGNAVFGDFNRRLTYTPTAPLGEDAQIVVRLTDGLIDTCSQPLQTPTVGETLFSFATQPPDAEAPIAPVVNPVPSLTKNALINVSGDAEPSSIVTVSGGLAPTSGTATAGGSFNIPVPLKQNQSNSLLVQAEDASGNLSPAVGSDRDGEPLLVLQDNTPPALTVLIPANATTGVPLGTVVDVLFDSELDPASVNATNFVLEGSVIPGSLALNGDNTGFTFTPDSPLDYNKTYSVRMPAGGIKDLAGNGLSTELAASFTTESYPLPTVASVSPAQAVQGTGVTVIFSGTNLSEASGVVSDNSGISGSVTSATATSVTATLSISETAAPNATTLGLTTPGGSASTAFTVVPATPSLISVTPNQGEQGQTLSVTFQGDNLATASAVLSDNPGVSGTVSSASDAAVTASVTISPSAAVGTTTLGLTTDGGDLALAFEVLPAVPTLTALDPTSGVQGQTSTVTFDGDNLGTATGVIAGITGISGSITSTSDTQVTASITVAASATLGATTLGIMTAGGAASMPFTVVPPAPTLATLSPNSGLQGTTVSVALTGTNLATAATVISDNTGISGTVLSATGTSASLELVIDPIAATGPSQVGVSTAGGSALGAFTVLHKAPVISAIVPGGGLPGTVVDAVIQGSGLSDITSININGEWVSVSLLDGLTVEVVPVSYSFDRATDTGTYQYHDWSGMQLIDGDYGIKPWSADLGNGNAYEWVGWVNDTPVNIDFDFGTETAVDEIHVGTSQDFPGDVVLPHVDIFASDDGVNWTLIAGLLVPESTDNNDSYRTYVLTGLNESARYYRVQARHSVDGPWTFIDEVDFFQGVSAGSDTARAVRFTIDSSADLGARQVTLFTPGGSASATFTVVAPPSPATVDSIMPAQTNLSSVLVTGDADPGAVISILDGLDGVETVGTADSSGSFVIAVPLLAEGAHPLSVTAANAYGNSAPAVSVDTNGDALSVIRDLTAPTASTSSPLDGVTGVALDTTVVVQFSEAIAPATVVSGSTFLLEGSVIPGAIVVAPDNLSLEFTPDDPLLPAKTYSVRIPTGGITDLAGNGLASEFTSSFTTTTELEVDLNTWSKESVAGNGTWTVSGDGQTVLQTINGNPTFFVSPDAVIDQTITGRLKVETTSDDDFIGFVFGYQSPIASNGDGNNDFDFWLFDWKQANQSLASEGFTLSRVKGNISDYGLFWNHPSGASALWDYPVDGTAFDTIATNYSTTLGWADNVEYDFTLEYTSTRIRISIKATNPANDARFATEQVIFDVTPADVWGAGTDRAFTAGRFGFYNYSQERVRYTGFVQNVQSPPPAPTLTDVLPAGAVPGSSVVLTLTGTDLHTAYEVVSTHADVDASILSASADGTALEVELTVGAGAPPGAADLTVTTFGGSDAVGFVVDNMPTLAPFGDS